MLVSDVVPVRNALISVSDKMGLTDLAAGLRAAGVTIYSTGGTRTHLQKSGIDVEDVAEYTGFPEMLDGRVSSHDAVGVDLLFPGPAGRLGTVEA